MTKGGGGVWKPPKLADIICEQPFTSLPHWDAIIVDSLNTALWVKSGNRGNLKCLNVNDHYEFILYRKMFISFLSEAKLLHVYD